MLISDRDRRSRPPIDMGVIRRTIQKIPFRSKGTTQ
jgi:hypothetical protein